MLGAQPRVRAGTFLSLEPLVPQAGLTAEQRAMLDAVDITDERLVEE